MTPKFRVSTVMHDHPQTVNFLTMFEKKKNENFFFQTIHINYALSLLCMIIPKR
jgi:hypothetical protein